VSDGDRVAKFVLNAEGERLTYKQPSANLRVKRANSGSVNGDRSKENFGDWVCERANYLAIFLMV
jgi:endonuclease I